MRIGEVADAAGTNAKTLRFYEEQGLLPEVGRTPAGYRDYPPEAVARVDFVHRGKAAGLTLAQIKQILDIRDRDQAPCEHVRDPLDTKLADLDEQIRRLTELRGTVTELRDRAATSDPDRCRADQVCQYL
ncbi:hypoxia response transcriptional regulator [Myceligenerans halotolerans]